MSAMRRANSCPVVVGAIVLLETVTCQAPLVESASASAGQPVKFKPLEKESLVVTSAYYIGPEDVLEVIVWRNKDVSKLVTVRPDGRISLPLIGDVQASGLTPSELTSQIAARLKEFMEAPAVSVILKEVNSYSIYVVGQVARAGRYFLKSKTTLLQAITLAGGFTTSADRSRIVILRWEGPNTEVKLKANYTDIVLKDHANENIVLKPGDTIVVPSETMVLTN
jgi:polysaccharide export outer membrane protein